uniref:Reverse transcriptase domain-containing protein n=1 Tax=Cannabis sativa TaxID=3483 RepID=A0A803QK36_CANSA
MSGHWKGRYPVTITDHHSGLFSVSFGCEGDKRMALIMEPWHFQNHHIVLREPCALQEVTEDSLHQSPFWVQLHRLPFLSKSKAMAKWAGNIVGTYLDVDEDSLHEGWGPYLRFQALLDLSKPLLRGKMAKLGTLRENFGWNLDTNEPTLEYGPEMMGAPLPSSGYDRYRTDFFKGNAWPLMTRLAKKSFAAVLPRIHDRPNPHSYKLTVTESSTPSTTNLSHQSSHVNHVSSSQTTPHDPSIIPFPSYLPISLPTNIPNSTPSFATYPPHTNLHYSSPPIINSTFLKQKGIMTDSTSISIPFSDITNNMPQSIAVPHINGPQYIDDNAPGHNPASKRPIESESLRKFLKRCRSHNNGQTDTPATTDRSSASVLSGVDQQAIQAVLDTIPELISRESQEVLSSPFTATEVYAALKSMSEDSSPGVDGMSVMFYTTYWHIVGSLVTSSVLDVLNHGGDPSSFNRTLITLIPKVKKPSRITQYRPISLCNVLYKLVSKTIVLRIQPYLAVVISEFQSAFLSQRLITDNILVAFEVLHSLKTRKRGRQGYAAMKLDMSKAFDRVEWHFLEQVMLKLGFGFPMVELILRCLKSVSYSFLLNGSIQGSITPQRGIRQGDPLSPYLFLICSEGFSRLLQFQESIGALQGLKVSRSAPPITHLLFADDSVLFCRASRSSARAIHLCLDLYSRASGQLLNPEKSVLSFSPNTRTTEQHFFQHLLNMPIQPCHEQYLGLPSFSGRDKSQLFSGITDKIWKLMNAWREQLFSIGGKEVLLKAVVQAIPTYAMSCFQLPVKLCNQIEQLMSRFWWGKSANGNAIHWKNWKFLCKSKVHGGMGFRNFVHFNQALLAKQAWRILEDPSSLLARVLKSRYFATGVFLEATAGAQPSLTWKSIVWGPSNFKPLLFLSSDRDVKVADFITHSRQWDVPKLQQFFTPPDVDRILSIPLSLFPCEDVLLWHYSSAGFYTVKSGYKLASDVLDSQPNKTQNESRCLVNVATGVFGLAAILRNSTGDILAAMVKPMKGCVKAEEMEALAIAWGLKLLLHLRLNVDFIESDSLMVVNGLKSHFKGLSAFHVILNDITFLLSNFPRAQISHVYRSANNEAHLLAKFALTVDSDCTWLEEVPPPLMTVM